MSANNGQSAPGWFKDFVSEYRDDRNVFFRAIRSWTKHVNRNSAEIHEMRLEMEQVKRGLERTTKELAHTRTQSAKLFRRLIAEVKALRPRR